MSTLDQPRNAARWLLMLACACSSRPAAPREGSATSAHEASPPVRRIEPRVAQHFEEPRFDDSAPPSPDFYPVTYAVRGQQPLRLFVFPVARKVGRERASAILLFHSGGWTRGRPEWLFGLARRFASLGLVAVPVQYRLSKDGVTPVDAFADACSAFAWVRQDADRLGVRPDRVAGWGASAGGQLVAATATAGCKAEGGAPATKGADALILVSAGVDPAHSSQFRKLVGEGVDPNAYSPLAHAKAGSPATLLIVGEQDSVTTEAQAQAFCSKLREAGVDCTLIAYPGLGHLLSRRLEDQRSSVDPDPQAELKAYEEQVKFLERLRFVEGAP